MSGIVHNNVVLELKRILWLCGQVTGYDWSRWCRPECLRDRLERHKIQIEAKTQIHLIKTEFGKGTVVESGLGTATEARSSHRISF